MLRTCIAVADAARARVFLFDASAGISGIQGTLTERTDLVNPARRKTPAQLFSDSRPGTSRMGGLQYALDDHRDAHIDELDLQFTREIAAAIDHAIEETGATRLVVCASPRMLGMLRAAHRPHGGLTVEEIARDYTKLTTPQIHERLVAHGLLPAAPPRAGLSRSG